MLEVLVAHWAQALLDFLSQLLATPLSHCRKTVGSQRQAHFFFEPRSVVQVTCLSTALRQLLVSGVEPLQLPVQKL